MKGFALVSRGIEGTAADDIKRISGAENIQIKEGLVLFELDDVEGFCRLAYLCQSVSRICVYLAEFRAGSVLEESVGSLRKKLEGLKAGDWCGGSFSVECFRRGDHDFNSHDFGIESSKIIEGRADFKNPEMKFCCFIDSSEAFFGVDVAGFDLSKRDYRIFGHSSDLKATLAYALVRLGGYDSGKVLLDPFSRSGSISVEAALFALGFPVNYHRKDSFSFLRLKPFSKIDFDRMFSEMDAQIENRKLKIYNFSNAMPHLKSAEKNAKISGVNKFIKFSRVDLELLDLKFEKEKVDVIISYPPFISRMSNPKRIMKVYSEFFYQASHILKRDGKAVVASRDSNDLRESAEKHGFRLSSVSEFSMGQEIRFGLVFEKK